MTKEEKKRKKAEKAKFLMPKWVRTLLILGGMLLCVGTIVFAVMAQTGYTKWFLSTPNFTAVDTSATLPFTIFTIILAVLGLALYVLHFVLPKAVYKKKISIGNVVFATLILFSTAIGGIMGAAVNADSVMSISDISYCAGSSNNYVFRAIDVSKHLTKTLSANAITDFLDNNSSLKCIVSGIRNDESKANNFSSHPHKAYTATNSKMIICDFYLGKTDISSLSSILTNYSMPSDKNMNQEIWVTYGSSQVTTAGYHLYSEIVPNFTKAVSSIEGVSLLLDEENNAMRLLFSSK